MLLLLMLLVLLLLLIVLLRRMGLRRRGRSASVSSRGPCPEVLHELLGEVLCVGGGAGAVRLQGVLPRGLLLVLLLLWLWRRGRCLRSSSASPDDLGGLGGPGVRLAVELVVDVVVADVLERGAAR